MKSDFSHLLLVLTPAQVLRVRAVAGTTLRCETGRLWVTQEGLARDDFLTAGETLPLSSAGVTVAEAIGAMGARLSLCRPARRSGKIRIGPATADL
jgi:hypothetical protein